MMLVPYVGNTPINAASAVTVVTDPADQQRVNALVARCSVFGLVDDEQSLCVARRLGGEVRALENEIANEKRLAKAPFRAIENAIEERAKEIAGPLLAEKWRLADLLAAHVARLEAAEKAEQQRREAALQAQVAQQQKQIQEAQDARKKAETELRTATDEAAAVAAREAVLKAKLAAAQAQLSQELAEEASKIGAGQPVRGKIPGGRVNHPYDFRVTSVRDALKAGFLRLFRWELDKRACADEVRAQLETMPETEPRIPGIEITRTIKISLKPAARIK
jgi:hypothetical protein